MHRSRFAWLFALTALAGCESTSSAQGVDARVSADAADVTDGSDGSDAAGAASFHGVPITAWDRAMPDVDAIGYEVDLRVDESTAGSEAFTAQVRGVFVATRALDALSLDYEGDDVDAAEVDGRPAQASRANGALTVALGRTVAEGERFAVTVRLRGRLFQATGVNPNDFRAFGGLMAFQRNRAGRKIYESLNWPSKARRWLPLRDHPRDGAMLAMRATFPSAYTVLSNGRLESAADNADGTRTWSYFCATPMPTYDIHVAAYDDWAETAAMSERHQRAVRWLPYSGDRAAGETMFRELPAAMDYYEDTFGLFRWEQAVFLEVPIFGGGMEHATLVSMDETLFRTPMRSRQVSFHELAHHWSGNLVRIATWNDFWLSEGFTDYLTGRFMESHDGAAAGLAVWRTFLNSAMAAERGAAHHAMRPADPEVDVLTIFDAISYKKGAFVLRMLEHRLGTAAFTAFMRGWFERHAGGAATTQTFERELDAAFAGRGVPEVFRQFVYGEGQPTLNVSPRYDAATMRLTLTLRQVQARGPAEGFAFPVEVEFARGEKRERVTVEVRGMSTVREVPLSFDPTSVVIDPDEVTYVATACTTAARCHAGYTCAALGADTQTVCVPPRQ
jgi:aminopeptidase N